MEAARLASFDRDLARMPIRRADVLAAIAQLRGTQVLLSAARRALDPQLDLQVNLGYAGLAEGSDAAPF